VRHNHQVVVAGSFSINKTLVLQAIHREWRLLTTRSRTALCRLLFSRMPRAECTVYLDRRVANLTASARICFTYHIEAQRLAQYLRLDWVRGDVLGRSSRIGNWDCWLCCWWRRLSCWCFRRNWEEWGLCRSWWRGRSSALWGWGGCKSEGKECYNLRARDMSQDSHCFHWSLPRNSLLYLEININRIH